MIPPDDRQKAVELIVDAISDGARLGKSYEVLEISIRTYQRWKSGKISDKRKGAPKNIPRKLNDFERQEIIDTCNN